MKRLYRVIYLKRNDPRRYVKFHRAVNGQQAVAITRNNVHSFDKCVAVYDDSKIRS